MGKKVFAIVVAVLIIAGAAAWRLLHIPEMAFIGAGYSAQQVCACVFVSQRTQESCRGDLEPLAQKVVSVAVGQDRVTATAFFFSRATARFEKPLGCSIRD